MIIFYFLFKNSDESMKLLEHGNFLLLNYEIILNNRPRKLCD